MIQGRTGSNFGPFPFQRMNFAPHLGRFLPLAAFSLSAHATQWVDGDGFRWAPLSVPPSNQPGFTLLSPAQSGILWTNSITPEAVARHYNMVSGAGVAAGDFDADGLCDLYFCNRGGENALFRNLGHGRFTNVTASAKLTVANSSSTGAAFADLNGDGLLDLLVNSFLGPGHCFLNLGSGQFTNATAHSGLLSRGGATSLALGDLDGDADLDLYVAYFGVEAILREGGRIAFNMVNGQPVVTGRHARRLKIIDGELVEFGDQDVLYLNDGSARFTPANWPAFFSDEEGQPIRSAPLDFGLAVQIRDINQDGHPDIYVCNDFQTPDRLWLNDGRGRFSAISPLALRSISYASMGVDFADLDRDGWLDFITVDMLSREHPHRLRQFNSMPPLSREIGPGAQPIPVPRNTLFWNRGDGTYAEIARLTGLSASDWSWTPIFLDVDLDGFEDLLVSTGSLYDVMDRDAATAAKDAETRGAHPRARLSLYPRLDNPNAAFRNRGDLTFEDVSRAWNFDARQISYGMALADLDNDGDLDVAINCANAAPLIYLNNASAPRVAVRLQGQPPNTHGIGAKVTLRNGASPLQFQEIIAGGRYMSGGQPMRTFAAGTSATQMELEVAWRSGRRTRLTGVQPNRIYEIHEPAPNP